jgi:hypothetical protein
MADGMDTVKEEVKPPEAPAERGPAADIRDIQALLVNGIYPGQVAPQVVKSFQLLEQMAREIEKGASKEAK